MWSFKRLNIKKNYSEVFVDQCCIIEYNKRILLLNIKKLINMVNTSVNLKYLRKDGKSNKVLLKLLEKPEFNKIIEDITSNYTKIYEEHQNFVWIAVKLQKIWGLKSVKGSLKSYVVIDILENSIPKLYIDSKYEFIFRNIPELNRYIIKKSNKPIFIGFKAINNTLTEATQAKSMISARGFIRSR